MENPEGNAVKHQFPAPECSESSSVWFITAFQESSCTPCDHLLFHLYRDQMETHGGAPYQHFFPVATFGTGNSGFVRNTSVANFQRINAFIVVFPHTWNKSSGMCELPGNLCDTLHQIIKKKKSILLAVSFSTVQVYDAWGSVTRLWCGSQSRGLYGALSLWVLVLKWKVKVGFRQNAE